MELILRTSTDGDVRRLYLFGHCLRTRKWDHESAQCIILKKERKKEFMQTLRFRRCVAVLHDGEEWALKLTVKGVQNEL